MDAVRTHNVWYPGTHIEQPFGPGTKFYNDYEIIEMIYDMEEYEHFEQPFDKLGILSQRPNSEEIVTSQIINSIMPIGLQNEIYQKSGDIFTYCISTDKPRIHGNLKYKQDTCQIKFRMRVAAAYNRIPGFRKISGYEQYMKMGPGMLMT